jgi:predicted SnoaL-like aldol condensation-catalyzing enzyme
MTPIVSKEAQYALLRSDDPQLAANKKLVYDMYRTIVQGGNADRVAEFFTEGYIQHNPNVESGRDNLAAFLRGSRPARPVEETLTLPLVNIIAERDIVMLLFQRREKDERGEYLTSWFDVFRIEDGKVAEHWDPALRSPEMLKFDPNVQQKG